MRKLAKMTSKGQITVPRAIRQILGVQAGDELLFESDGTEVRVRAAKAESPFSKYRGIGNPGICSGRIGITQWIDSVRGE